MVSNLTDKEGRQSKGVLLLRTLAMPSDTNANGDIFGGWIMRDRCRIYLCRGWERR